MKNSASDAAWNAYMAQRKVEDAAEIAWTVELAAGIQNGPAEKAWERAERKAARLLTSYQRSVNHIRN